MTMFSYFVVFLLVLLSQILIICNAHTHHHDHMDMDMGNKPKNTADPKGDMKTMSHMDFSFRGTFLLIIYDGFRHDYPEIYKKRGIELPNFEQFMKEGVCVTKVRNVYPTVTFPNHQTLVTGLYAESHGVVCNEYIDPKYPKSVFSMPNQSALNEDFWMEGWPDPIYITNQKQGGRSAVLLYPNSDTAYDGHRAFLQVDQYWLLNGFPALYSYKRRVDRMVYWLTNRDLYNVNLGILYFDEPDETGHKFGHDSTQVGDKLKELDYYLGYLVSELKRNNLYENLNIVITADHGMSTTNSSYVIYLDKYVPQSWYDNPLGFQDSLYFFIYPKEGKTKDIISAVEKAKLPHLHAYSKDTMPKRFHLSHNIRTSPVLIMCDSPYIIALNSTVKVFTSSNQSRGVHGYDNNNTDMWPIFMARGPAFKEGAIMSDPIESVDLYPLMCSLLGISPNPNNGSLDRISGVLKGSVRDYLKTAAEPVSFLSAFSVLICLTFAMVSVIVLSYLCSCFAPKQQHNYRGLT